MCFLFGLTESDRAELARMLRLCEPLTSADDVTLLKDWLSDTWINLAMVDYPYAASFLEPLPGWPIKVQCAFVIRFCHLAIYNTCIRATLMATFQENMIKPVPAES